MRPLSAKAIKHGTNVRRIGPFFLSHPSRVRCCSLAYCEIAFRCIVVPVTPVRVVVFIIASVNGTCYGLCFACGPFGGPQQAPNAQNGLAFLRSLH